jgi:hypothetical protein
MNLTFKHPTNSTLELHPNNFVKAKNIEPGTTVICDKGILWLTLSEDYHDYMLQSGEKIVINEKHNILIEALSEAGLSIVYPN